MLDENLPTFHFRPSADSALSSIVYLTQYGSDPTPEYVLRRADPSQPGGRNKYAVALCSPVGADIVYAEVDVAPEWTQPTLSAAEIRAQSGAAPPPPVPVVPDAFSVLLYNPDQAVTFKLVAGGWNKSDSWEFEMPTQSFKVPSASELDRQQQTGGPVDLVPRIMFRWKKDGRLTKDMTCYMTGKSLGGNKSKEPDITVALFKAGKDSAMTIYQPNLQRVEVEDMKGLEVVLLLAAEVIRDLYLAPRHDVFNTAGSAPGAVTDGRRRTSSRPGTAPSPVGATMSGALGNLPPGGTTATPSAQTADVEAETRRLQAMVEREQREEREREKRDRAEQKRIKKMLDEEDRERRRREAEVAKETERLRKKYGTEGQDLPSTNTVASPPLPPRSWAGVGTPPRPVSVGPLPNGYGAPSYGWGGPAAASPPPPQGGPSGQGWRRNGSGGGGLNLQNPTASVSTFFGLNRSEEAPRKVQKKRSSHW